MNIVRTRAALTGLAVAIFVVASHNLPRAQSKTGSGPKLLVLLVVDQMRADYLDRNARHFQRGLRRLLTEGAVFDRAAYPYLSTVTCAGHATIGTGALPATHGMISNEWWSRADARRILCTDDVTAQSVAYLGGPEKASHSARRLRVPTLGDQLRAASQQSQVVTLSMKPRSAVMLAGKSGTAVTWFVDSTHGWATSSAFGSAPVQAVQAFVSAHPIDRDRAEVWVPLNPGSFTGVDDASGERPKRGWTTRFPHPLAGDPGTPQSQFYELWKCSPYGDRYLAAMGTSLVRSMRLGQRGVVDLLGLGLSSLDCIGHDFGPDSAEVHDALLRLDETLATFFEALDATVGRDNYTVALSSDHGASPIPEQVRARGLDAGRVLSPEIRKAAEAAMVAAYGPGPYIDSVLAPHVHFTPPIHARVTKEPEYARPAVEAISRISGVLRVLHGRGLESKRASSDPIERAAALSYHPVESGDLIFVLKEHWVTGDSSAAGHGTHHPYDQRVPVVLMGAAIKPGRHSTVASPADIAPTLASLVGIRMPHATGSVLRAALR